MVIQNQNARIRISLAIKVSRGEPADAAADHHQVVEFFCFDGRARTLAEIPVAHRMRSFKGAVRAATHSRKCGRIVARLFLRKEFASLSGPFQSGNPASRDGAANPDGYAIQKITARYWPKHSKLAIAFNTHVCSPICPTSLAISCAGLASRPVPQCKKQKHEASIAGCAAAMLSCNSCSGQIAAERFRRGVAQPG